jgi:hypothetical protein
MAEAKRKRSRGYLNSKHVKELSQNKRYTLHRSQGPGEDFDDDEKFLQLLTKMNPSKKKNILNRLNFKKSI